MYNPLINPPTFGLPAGSPPVLRSAAEELTAIASELTAASRQTVTTVLSVPRWEGDAREAANAKAMRTSARLDQVAEALRFAARALQDLAAELEAAQITTANAQQQAYQIAAAAANTVFPGADLFWSVMGMASAADSRADEAKRQAALVFRQLAAAAPSYEPPPPPPAKPEPKRGWFSKAAHGVLDVGGMVPVIGEPLDLLNASIYLAEGDELNAGLAASSAVPVYGWIPTLGKWGKRGADAISAGGRQVDEVPATPLLGGGDRVPPVHPPGDPGYWPKRQPEPQPQRDVPVIEPTPTTPSRPGTGFDREPVEVPSDPAKRFQEAALGARGGGGGRSGGPGGGSGGPGGGSGGPGGGSGGGSHGPGGIDPDEPPTWAFGAMSQARQGVDELGPRRSGGTGPSDGG